MVRGQQPKQLHVPPMGFENVHVPEVVVLQVRRRYTKSRAYFQWFIYDSERTHMYRRIKEGRCTKCGDVVSTVEIKVPGHSYGSWETIRRPPVQKKELEKVSAQDAQQQQQRKYGNRA